MKKNICKLIAQIKPNNPTTKETFKITSKNLTQYTNKILVDSEAYNQPGSAEKFIKEQMSQYKVSQNNQINKNVAELNERVKEKVEKTKIQDQLYLTERDKKYFDSLYLEELLAEIRTAYKQKKSEQGENLLRKQMIKLEDSISFTLENEDLDPTVAMYLNQFLIELTKIINKPSKIY